MNRRKVVTMLLLAVALVVLVNAPANAGYKIGDKAMQISLKNVDEKTYSTAEQTSAKGFIVVFTCNHCPFAKKYEGRIMDLDKKYASKGYPVVAVMSNDPKQAKEDAFDKMVARAKEKKYTFPYLYDESQDVVKAYGATNTPHVFVVNKENGELVVKYIGTIDDNIEDPMAAPRHYVEDAVNALLAGKPVPLTETKAIGCMILLKKKK